jgi:DNA-binding response OmpR family regulator
MTAPGHKPGSRSVLLAEHEPEVAEMSARYLRRDGLRVRLVTTPEQALAELTAGPDSAAVLDLTMPGLDPRRIRRALRTPVIFLVAGLQGPRPRGLARGGVSGSRRWLARPFGPRQLVAVVRDVLATPVPPPAGDAGELKLTATETAVLAALLGQQGRVLSRRQLLTAAGRPAAGDRAVDVVIAQLRAKIGGAGSIRTVRGAGYVIDPGQIRTPARFQGGSHRGAGAAGLPSVAQQYRFEGTIEPRECARRDPRRRACRSRRTAAARLS